MRRQRPQRPAAVLADGLWGVKLWEVIVRVHCYQDVGYERLPEEGEEEQGQRTGGQDGDQGREEG